MRKYCRIFHLIHCKVKLRDWFLFVFSGSWCYSLTTHPTSKVFGSQWKRTRSYIAVLKRHVRWTQVGVVKYFWCWQVWARANGLLVCRNPSPPESSVVLWSDSVTRAAFLASSAEAKALHCWEGGGALGQSLTIYRCPSASGWAIMESLLG